MNAKTRPNRRYRSLCVKTKHLSLALKVWLLVLAYNPGIASSGGVSATQNQKLGVVIKAHPTFSIPVLQELPSAFPLTKRY